MGRGIDTLINGGHISRPMASIITRNRDQAMREGKKLFSRLGFKVTDVSSQGCGYDLRIEKRKKTFKVEVKFRGPTKETEINAGNIRAIEKARADEYLLWVYYKPQKASPGTWHLLRKKDLTPKRRRETITWRPIINDEDRECALRFIRMQG